MRQRPSRPRLRRWMLTLGAPRVGAVVAFAVVAVWSALVAGPREAAAQSAGAVHVLRVDGMINPISERYVLRGIERAEAQRAVLLVLELDTPGGLLESTQAITTALLASQVPVAVYVSPPGGRAASAGVFITVASHVAAMAPSTRIGAATPIDLQGDVEDDALRKVLNDTVVYGRSLAEARGRNAEWVELAVREAAVVDAPEAVSLGVVDLLAADRGGLLIALDGRVVTTVAGERTLRTAAAHVESIPMSFIERMFMLVANPTVALLLLSLGGIGLYFELANPGAMIPGILGTLFLIVALFSLGMLPVDTAGLLLVLLGLVLLGAEVFVASGGILGAGGVAAFAIGALLLIDESQEPFVQVSRPVVLALSASMGVFMLILMRGVLAARSRPVAIGDGEWAGRVARVRSADEVSVNGELWHARPERGEAALRPGTGVRVVRREGLTLVVEPLVGERSDRPTDPPVDASGTDAGARQGGNAWISTRGSRRSARSRSS